MSTLLIDASPKKRFSNSAYLMGFSKVFMNSRANPCIKAKLPRIPKYGKIFETIKKCDRVVLATPLYVDGLPSHVLRFLKELEVFCKKENITFKMYVISNCGFYEGHQTKTLLLQVKAWCKRAGVEWKGGVGIGGGEMIGFLRLTLLIYVGLFLLFPIKELLIQVLNSSYSLQALYSSLYIKSFLIRVGIFILFNISTAYLLIRIGLKVKKGKFMNNKYSVISFCPKFLFVIFANIFWALRLCIVNRKLPNKFYSREKLNNN